jgi:hypothetical protein
VKAFGPFRKGAEKMTAKILALIILALITTISAILMCINGYQGHYFCTGFMGVIFLISMAAFVYGIKNPDATITKNHEQGKGKVK